MPGPGQTVYLTNRQIQVLQLAVDGLSGKQIARHLGISPRTVEDHFSRMRLRTGAWNDSELVAHGLAAGIIIPPTGPSIHHQIGNEAPAGRTRDEEPADRSAGITSDGATHDDFSGERTIIPPRTAIHADPPINAPRAALIGYAWVYKAAQSLDWQIRALKDARCLLVFADSNANRTATRPELQACLDCLRPGDTLVVPSIDRVSSSLPDLIALVSAMRNREVGFRSLHEALDTTTPDGRLIFQLFAALAEFIRELTVDGRRQHSTTACTRGILLGRPPAMTTEQICHACALLAQPDNALSSIARLLGISRSTIYKHIPQFARGVGNLQLRPLNGKPRD
jgi:DNA invertase Pin-like site-specific DNA recombinase